MSISAVSTSSGIVVATPQIASPAASNSSNTVTTTSTQTDTVTLGTTAQSFASVLRQLHSKLNAYEHQATWQVDHKTAVTAPSGTTSAAATTTSNSSTGTATPTNDQSVADGFTSLQNSFENQLQGLTADQQSQLATENQTLAKEQTRFQSFIDNRGKPSLDSASRELSSKVNAYEHQVTWQIDHGTAVTSPANESTAASDSSSGAIASNTSTGTIAPTNASSGTVVSNSSTGTVTSSNNSSGTVTSNDSSGTIVSTNDSTGTIATSNSSTGTADLTTAQVIANAFSSLESNAKGELGTLTTDQTAQFQQLQQKLTSEQSRFTAFIAKRSAYLSTQSTKGATQDVAA